MIHRALHRTLSFPALPGILIVLSFASFSSSAAGNTISQSLNFRLNQNTSAATLSYTPFDSSLGTLENIGISFAATRRHAWGIWNVSDDKASVPYDVTLTDTTLTLDSNVFGFADLHYGPGVTPELDSSLSVYSSEVDAGTAEFLAGLDPVFPSAYQPSTTLTSITGGFSPSPAFVGTLDLAYAYDPGVFDIESDNFLFASLVDVYGTATVTYTFRPAALPDSPLGLWLAAVWLGVIGVARARRSHLAR